MNINVLNEYLKLNGIQKKIDSTIAKLITIDIYQCIRCDNFPQILIDFFEKQRKKFLKNNYKLTSEFGELRDIFLDIDKKSNPQKLYNFIEKKLPKDIFISTNDFIKLLDFYTDKNIGIKNNSYLIIYDLNYENVSLIYDLSKINDIEKILKKMKTDFIDYKKNFENKIQKIEAGIYTLKNVLPIDEINFLKKQINLISKIDKFLINIYIKKLTNRFQFLCEKGNFEKLSDFIKKNEKFNFSKTFENGENCCTLLAKCNPQIIPKILNLLPKITVIELCLFQNKNNQTVKDILEKDAKHYKKILFIINRIIEGKSSNYDKNLEIMADLTFKLKEKIGLKKAFETVLKNGNKLNPNFESDVQISIKQNKINLNKEEDLEYFINKYIV